MSLSLLIQKLRGGRFCLYDVLESGLIPEETLGVLVCDYVEFLQSRLSLREKGMHIKGVEAVTTKRLWLIGQCDNVELGRVRAVVQQQMAATPEDEALFFAWASTFASSEKALGAVLEGLRRKSSELSLYFDTEVRWIGNRLALFLERDRATSSHPWMPTPSPVTTPSFKFFDS